jgi:hypothetical protein
VPFPDEQDKDVRGSIADIDRRLGKAKASLDDAVLSLNRDDPEGARYALDEAESQIQAAGRDALTAKDALKRARGPGAP